jgi:transposase-like protein
MTSLTAPRFRNEAAARKHLEAVRWPDGPICPHCGVVDNASRIKGKSARPGLWFCGDCRKQFTVTVGTVFERSKVPLHKWLLAVHLLTSSKKGMSAHQLHRMLDVTYKTAWFMAHRIREAMRPGNDVGPMGGAGKVVEVDETLIGGKEKNKHVSKRNPKNIGSMGKITTFSLVERGGRVRSFHVASVSAKNLGPILFTQVDRASTLMSDDAGQYRILGPEFARHESVNHRIDEYVRGEAHTNTIEGYFSLLKRGLHGNYHHVSEAHLKRYLCEFDFRYNERSKLGVEDAERADKALKGIAGKRLTYRRTNETANA